MKPFNFRLETLLTFRKMEKEQSQLELAEAATQCSHEREVLAELEGKLTDNIALIQSQQQQSTSIEKLLAFRYYVDKLNLDTTQQKQRLVAAEERYQECLLSLVAVTKKHKIVEKFREKKFGQHQIAAMDEEQKLLDEMSLQIYTRNK